MQPTTTSYAILGLLSLRDWTTYELAQQMQRTLGFVWPRAERKLYDEPKRLAALGWVSSERDAVGKRARTTYSITDAGREALAEWLRTEPRPAGLEFEGALRVLFADQGDLASLRSSLCSVRDQAEEARVRLGLMCAGIAESDGGAFPDRLHVNAMGMRFLLGQYAWMAEWADWALAEAETWDGTDRTVAAAWHDAALSIFREGAQLAPG